MRGGRWCRRYPRPESFFEISPATAVPFEQLVGVLRAPGPCRVVWKVPRWQGTPHIEHRADHAPAGFDHIGALKQSLIADHAIVQQTFISGTRLHSEIVRILEIHVDRAQAHLRAWRLGRKTQRDA